jgi:bacterioferritin
MQGQPAVIDVLNEVLTGELTSVNQYFIHAKMCANWGYKKLHEHIYKESIDEMKHADQLIERILYLDGLPNLQRYHKVNVGTTVPEQLKLDLEVERSAIKLLNDGVKLCRDAGDNGTRELLEGILVSEEHHADWLETQLRLVAHVGVENYLAQQM